MSKSKTKKALIGSAGALVLCFALLLGTTFAWFTDNASTKVSSIQAGALSVDLQKQVGGKWESVDGETLGFINEQGGAVENALWEPGCTYALPALKVVNNGNLALKYKVEFGIAEGDQKLAEVLDVLVDGESTGLTLSDVLNSSDGDGVIHGNLANGVSSDAMTVSLHMKNSAGNEYRGLTLSGIRVTVLATQNTVEYDSTGNQYDAEADFVSGSPVYSVDELKAALANGKTEVAVMDDLCLSEPLNISGSVTIRSAGCTVAPAEGYTGTLFKVESGASLALQDITVSGGNEWSWLDGQKASMTMPLTGDGYDITKAVTSKGTELTGSLITSAGDLVLGESCVIENAYYIGKWGLNPIVKATGGTLTLDGAVVRNTLGTLFSVDETEVCIKDCSIRDNFAYNANKGGIFALFNSTCTMSGGTIAGNAGHVRSGFVFGVINGSKLTMNGGLITENYVKNRGSSTGSVVCCESGGDFDMNGGSITNNRGVLAGAFSARWVFNGDTSNTIINLNGGTISGNTCIENTWHNAEVFIRDTVTTIGPNMEVVGNVVLDSGTAKLTNNGTITGNVFVQNAGATMTNNGTVNGDVTVTAGAFIDNGTVTRSQ